MEKPKKPVKGAKSDLAICGITPEAFFKNKLIRFVLDELLENPMEFKRNFLSIVFDDLKIRELCKQVSLDYDQIYLIDIFNDLFDGFIEVFLEHKQKGGDDEK